MPFRILPFRTARHWAALAAILLLSGCLTIEENYTFKKNGSGTMEYVVDLSAFGEMMKSLGGEDKKKNEGLNGMDMKDEMKKLEGLPGIKKVKMKTENDGLIQRLSFAFKDLAALNGALNTLMPDSTGRQQEFFRWEGNTLVRTNNLHAAELGTDMAKDQDDPDSLDLGGVLQSMQYKYSFTFAKEITSTDVADGMTKETPGAKQVKLNTDWSVIMKDPKALDLRITLDQ